MNYPKRYYAEKIKGVKPSRVTQLIKEGKMITTIEYGKQVIVDCPQNDALFNRPSHNAKRKSNAE